MGREVLLLLGTLQAIQLTVDQANDSSGVPVVSAINSDHEAVGVSAEPTTHGVHEKLDRMLSR
jgi:hypothetical protein